MQIPGSLELTSKERLRREKIEQAKSVRKQKFALQEKVREEHKKKISEYKIKEEWQEKIKK